MEDWQDILSTNKWSTWLHNENSTISILRTALTDVFHNDVTKQADDKTKSNATTDTPEDIKKDRNEEGTAKAEKIPPIAIEDPKVIDQAPTKSKCRRTESFKSQERQSRKSEKGSQNDRNRRSKSLKTITRTSIHIEKSGSPRSIRSPRSDSFKLPEKAFVDVPLQVSRRVKSCETSNYLCGPVIVPPGRSRRSSSIFGTLISKDFMPLVRFRRAVRTIVLLLKATASSRHASQHHDQQVSWSQLADEHSTARRTYDLFGLTFDPSVFKAKREKYLSNEAKAILSLYPSDRTDDQIKLALLALNQTVDAFGEFPIKLQRSLASVGWYENFDAKRVIIRQGHVADNFYFILSGTAVVTLLESHKDTGEETVRTVAFLRKGNSFGELALMHGARRSATVTCKTNVELLAVSREDFIDIFMHIEKDREPEHIAFLRTIDLLRGWPLEKLPHDNPRICLFTFFRRGVLLCKDSNHSEWIYVIKSGTCRVLKDLIETKPNIPGLEFIPYTLNQAYIKLPPIPQPSRCQDSPRCRRATPLSDLSPRIKRIRLPTLNKRLSAHSSNSLEDHQNQINDIYDKRHNIPQRFRHIPIDDIGSARDNRSEGRHGDSKVFVQIQKLVPKDVFGLEQTVFGMMNSTTSCSLVSDGAECVLINKKFFMQHLSDRIAKQIRKTIQPIPTEESLQQKLQDKANWDAYKSMTVSNFIVFRKQVHEHEAEALFL